MPRAQGECQGQNRKVHHWHRRLQESKPNKCHGEPGEALQAATGKREIFSWLIWNFLCLPLFICSWGSLAVEIQVVSLVCYRRICAHIHQSLLCGLQQRIVQTVCCNADDGEVCEERGIMHALNSLTPPQTIIPFLCSLAVSPRPCEAAAIQISTSILIPGRHAGRVSRANMVRYSQHAMQKPKP